ncbi:hypothetical protein BDM02DRAFT_3106658 [Thelephora ganbajun]|uniref:Uncharacterized protein n=1 Tax=Thelephora ganbajun TaxID=370292 RepID=A0ACB6ZXY3_THEGA|nr:hypothetical protein BDM02DRAFT_3106658 [Thelephora ganbajun]
MTTVELSTSPLPRPPALSEEWRACRPDYLSVYGLVLDAERHANEQVKANPSYREAKDNLMFARVAGYLLIELYNRRAILSEVPCRSLVKQLKSLPREDGDTAHDVIFKIGQRKLNYLLRMFRTSTKKYPTPSLHPSRPSFDTLEDMTRDCMMVDSKDYRTARRKALARDDYRCILTGMFDRTSLRFSRELDQLRRGLDATFTTIQACHILNESTMQGIDPTGASEDTAVMSKTDYAVTAMSILRDFGLESHAQELLAPDGVHNLGNLLSLAQEVHTYFDNLDLWFEGTDEPNCYTVCVSDRGIERYLRMFGHLCVDGGRLYVTFSSNENTRLPDPKLLALHAACARVVRMSGAAEALDELERDVEGTRVLAFDGSSAHLLDHLMSRFATIPGVA